MHGLRARWRFIMEASAPSAAAGQLRSSDDSLAAAAGWILRAHHADGHGVPAWYSLVTGWSAAYPEVSGYLIPTLLAYARQHGVAAAALAAQQIGEWLLEIQQPEGWFQAGLVSDAPYPSVFNTAQGLQGLAALAQQTGQSRYLDAAGRAAGWVVRQQRKDGSFESKFLYCQMNKTYLARVGSCLLEYSRPAASADAREAACRLIAWVLQRQQAEGWFASCGFDSDDAQPTLHTIAYTIEGVLMAGVWSGEASWVARAQAAADGLLRAYRQHGTLSGRYGAAWMPRARYRNMPGCAQIALIWLELFRQTGTAAYHEAAASLLAVLNRRQCWQPDVPELHGALPGSDPVVGGYQRLRLLSWAVKFYMDALLLQKTLQPASMSVAAVGIA